MKRFWKVACGIVLIVLLAAGAGLWYLARSTRTSTYEKSGQRIDNPMRGAYVQCPTTDSYRLPQIEQEDPQLRVVLLTLDLSADRRSSAIGQERLEELQKALARAKEAGFGVIFRAAYDGFTGEYEDPDFEIILSHVRQICPVLNEYRGILMGVQAGFFGPFGEWHGSRYTDFDEEGAAYRAAFLQLLLDELHPSIPVGLRRQRFIREAQQEGLSIQRFGFYNDGLFGSDSDLGTYTEEGYDRAGELSWSRQHILVPFNGGEMPYVSEYSEISNAVLELQMLHVSYLNQYYNIKVWQSWEEQQYLQMRGDQYIQSHLGYRLAVSEMQANRFLLKRFPLQFRMAIENDGFSYFPEKGKAFLVLEHAGQHYEQEAEISFAKEGGEIRCQWKLPSELQMDFDQPVRIGLRLTLLPEEPQNEKYCVQLASQGVIYQEGCNWLGAYRAEGAFFQWEEGGPPSAEGDGA